MAYYNPDIAPVLSDNKGNSFTQLNIYNANNFNTLTLYYSSNPVVGTNHTFTLVNSGIYASLAVAAFSGTSGGPNPFDQQNGSANMSATTLQPGNVTPTTDNQLIVTAFTTATSGSMTVDSGFAITDQENFTSNSFGIALGYIINGAGTSGVAANPTWTNAGSAGALTTNAATFKAGP